ncbi:hypothetical protein ACWDV4_13065 [Micromonospora sp. NPDC003197]
MIHLDRLIHWAQLLHIPAHLLWFKLPEEQHREVKSGHTEVTHRSLPTTTTPLTPNADAGALAGLRAFLSNYLPERLALTEASIVVAEREAARIHDLYQRASYQTAAEQVPEVLAGATVLAEGGPRSQQVAALKILATAYLAASKLACKAGDGETALLTADRAATVARLVDDQALNAMAAYQAACALLRLPGRIGQAEQVVHLSIEKLLLKGRASNPDLTSATGALLLLAALIAARQAQTKETGKHLVHAGHLASELGADQNRLWTGFGPTNVAIHTLSAAVQAGEPDQAIRIGASLDTSHLPAALLGRRAQVHLDLATATAERQEESAVAVLHLMEAERIAPEILRFNIRSRALLADLLGRERQSVTPGLRPMAQRAGLLG